MSDRQRDEAGRAKCRDKTARGNLYFSKDEAKRAAVSMRRATGDPIHLFGCKFCGHYHLGCERSPDELRARRLRGGGE